MVQTEQNAPAHVMTGQNFDENRRLQRLLMPHPPFIDSPPATDPTPGQPTDVQSVEETPTNPRIAALQAMFPDFDPIILCVQLIPSPYRLRG